MWALSLSGMEGRKFNMQIIVEKLTFIEVYLAIKILN